MAAERGGLSPEERAKNVAGLWLASLWARRPPWLNGMPSRDDVDILVGLIAGALDPPRPSPFGMTPEQRRDLDEIAHNNAELHQLLRMYDQLAAQELPEGDWWYLAVATLARAATQYLKVAVDAEMRAPTRPIAPER